MIVEKQKARATLLARRRRAIIILSAVALVLIAAAITVNYFVRSTPFTDVDGTQYYVIRKAGKFGLYDAKGNKLEAPDEYSYFVTAAGTLVDVDADTGKTQIIAQVDTEDGEANSDRNQLLLFPKLGRNEISSIEVSNSNGSFTFLRYDVVNDKPDNSCDFIIEGAPLVSYDQDLFAELYVYAGYAISEYKIKDPIKDQNGEFSEYGLVPEVRIDEEGNTYNYEPAYYVITDMQGKSHKVIVGDMLVTGDGYYVQYINMTANGEVARNAVYVYDVAAANTLLAPVEKLTTPQILEQMSASDYIFVEDFTLLEYDENGKSTEKLNFTFIPLEERQGTIRANKPYVFNSKRLEGYNPNADNISDMLFNLYQPSFEGVCKLMPEDEDFVEYGLGKIQTFTDENGNEVSEFVFTPKYLISFYYDITDSSGNSKSTIKQVMYISDANENGNFYAYTYVYEGYPDGSREEKFLYVHDMISEVSAHTFDFLTWKPTKWISNNYTDNNIAFIDTIDISSGNYNAHFDLDNSKTEQDGEKVSSTLLTVTANDSKGHTTNTFSDLTVLDQNGYVWYITTADIKVMNSKGATVDADSTYYAYNTLGRNVKCISGKIICRDGTKVSVTPDTVEVTLPNGTTTEYVRFSTTLFRQLYETLLVATIVDTYEMSEEEEAALLADESKVILTMTLKDTEGEVKELKFYRLTSRKAYLAVNGVGGFYVMTDRVEKIVSDTQKFFSNVPINAMSKN